MTDLSSELEFAIQVAELGGRIALDRFRKDPAASRKADGTWVTEADWAVEAQIRLRIARAWPDHNILGEEEGLTRAGGGEPLDGAPTWVVDPIDGTNNYIAGIQVWAVLVGLKTEEGPIVGVCHAPALRETYDAARGHGARLNGSPIETSDVPSLEDATVLYAGAHRFHDRYRRFFDSLVEGSWRSRGFGDFWGHMLVARGSAHVMVEPELSDWDVTALVPVVDEAGGRMTHLDGSPWSGHGSCVTSCASLHDEVVGLYKSSDP